MANSSKQLIANLIQANEIIVEIAREGYDDIIMKEYFLQQSLFAQSAIDWAKRKLKDEFSVDYDAADANSKIIKQGSKVQVLVEHMDGMKGSFAVVKSYSLPAMLSDILMSDGMEMNGHKWLTNDEVKL